MGRLIGARAAMDMPKPTTEHRRLERLVGTWRGTLVGGRPLMRNSASSAIAVSLMTCAKPGIRPVPSVIAATICSRDKRVETSVSVGATGVVCGP